MSISQQIGTFHDKIVKDEHHRYRSWEHCYGFFQRIGRQGIAAQRDDAAVQLGFYLASWGMYRGSSFLLKGTYTVHRAVVDCLALPRFASLWEREFGSAPDEDVKLAPHILDAVKAIKKAYQPFATKQKTEATNTLVTKVLLGTLGCLPACDRYFIDGLRICGLKYSKLNESFVSQLLNFCRENLGELRKEQARIMAVSQVHYPLMKLVDMYFWQIGLESSAGRSTPGVKQGDITEPTGDFDDA